MRGPDVSYYEKRRLAITREIYCALFGGPTDAELGGSGESRRREHRVAEFVVSFWESVLDERNERPPLRQERPARTQSKARANADTGGKPKVSLVAGRSG